MSDSIPVYEPMTIGQRLRRKRRERGWTQEKAAAYFKITQPSYANWETDSVKPSGLKVRTIAIFLDTTFPDIWYLLNPSRDLQTVPHDEINDWEINDWDEAPAAQLQLVPATDWAITKPTTPHVRMFDNGEFHLDIIQLGGEILVMAASYAKSLGLYSSKELLRGVPTEMIGMREWPTQGGYHTCSHLTKAGYDFTLERRRNARLRNGASPVEFVERFEAWANADVWSKFGIVDRSGGVHAVDTPTDEGYGLNPYPSSDTASEQEERDTADVGAGCGKGSELSRTLSAESSMFDNGEFHLEFRPSDDGSFIVMAPGLARDLGFREAYDLLRAIPDDEQGYTTACTPGGMQEVGYVEERGFYRALGQRQPARIIDLSVRAAVERFQSWVYGEVLPSLRRGQSPVSVPQVQAPLSRKELAMMVIEAEDRAELAEGRAVVAEAQVIELQPSAEAWDVLADAEGDFLVGDAMKVLCRDPRIVIGQNRGFALLKQLGWIFGENHPYQTQVENGRLRERLRTWKHPKTGEEMASTQLRVTAKGIEALRKHLLKSAAEAASHDR